MVIKRIKYFIYKISLIWKFYSLKKLLKIVLLVLVLKYTLDGTWLYIYKTFMLSKCFYINRQFFRIGFIYVGNFFNFWYYPKRIDITCIICQDLLFSLFLSFKEMKKTIPYDSFNVSILLMEAFHSFKCAEDSLYEIQTIVRNKDNFYYQGRVSNETAIFLTQEFNVLVNECSNFSSILASDCIKDPTDMKILKLYCRKFIMLDANLKILKIFIEDLKVINVPFC